MKGEDVRRAVEHWSWAALVCLLAGGLLSMGVAVGFGLAGTVRVEQQSNAQVTQGSFGPVINFESRFPAYDVAMGRRGLPFPSATGTAGQLRRRGTGITDVTSFFNFDDLKLAAANPRPDAFYSHQTGWPWRAMEFRCFVPSATNLIVADPSGWVAPRWLARTVYCIDAGRTVPSARRPPVPLSPVTLGFLADSGLYGGVVFLVCLGGAVARRGRARRGLCLACGYSRSGLAPDAPCPECGTKPSLPSASITSAGEGRG